MQTCDQCDYKAPLTAGLKVHKELKHGKNKHFCDQCDYKTPIFKYLRSHKKSHEDYRFACIECDHKARQSTNSKKHIIIVHGKVRFKSEYFDYTAAREYLI